MYPIQAKVWKDIGLERLPMLTSHLQQQSTLKSIKTMVMNWQGFCAPAGRLESTQSTLLTTDATKVHPGTSTLRDMVLKGISYKDHSMLHVGLPHKLWIVPKSPTRGHQIEPWLSLTTDNNLDSMAPQGTTQTSCPKWFSLTLTQQPEWCLKAPPNHLYPKALPQYQQPINIE